MTQDATIYQGDDKNLDVTIWADAAKTTRRDINGASARYLIGKISSDSLVFAKAASITNGGQGTLRVTLTKTETAALAARRYTHQIVLTDINGLDSVVLDGFLTVRETLPTA